MSETTEKPSDDQLDLNAQQGPRRERPDSDVAPYPEPAETPETETAEPAPEDPVTGSPPVDPTPPSQQPKR